MARLEAELAERDKEVEHLKAAAAEEGQVSEHSFQCSGSMTFWIGSGSADPIRIRILLFSSLTCKMPTKNYIFVCIYLA
jgi:hypothetical protein